MFPADSGHSAMPPQRRRLHRNSLWRITGLPAAAFLVLLAAAGPVLAQFETAVVLGTVRDSTGGVVPDAAVLLRNMETGIEARSVSDNDGNFLFRNVRIGPYRVMADKPGFAAALVEDVRVTVGARQRVDIVLRVGEVVQSVQVEAVVGVESDSSDRGQVINAQQIVDLPLNGRNYSDLALLTTGVRQSVLALNGPREGSFNVNGQRSTFNNFLMDGLDNNAYGTSNQGFSNQVVQLAPDAVGEFRVVTTLPSAEYGRSSGAIINATMKSGTNTLHGSAWEFLRNTQLNAYGFVFAGQSATNKPVLQRNQFGGVLGGPVLRNRMFFFTSYEGFRQLQSSTRFVSLPTADQRAGVLPVTVANPLTGAVYPAGAAIPATAISPFARKVLDDLPQPNVDGAFTYVNVIRQTTRSDKMDVKLDGQINSRNTAFVRVSHRKMNNFTPPDIPGPSGGSGNGFVRALNQAIAVGYTFTMTPRSLLEARYGMTKTLGGKSPVGVPGPSMRELYGITGLPEDPRVTGGLTQQSISGFMSFGRSTTLPQFQNPFVYNPKVNFSFSYGRHMMKTGYEYQRIHTEIMDVNPTYGNDLYNGQFSKPSSGAPANTAMYNYADFLFGLRSEYQLATWYVLQYRQAMHFGYFQDDWKVNSRLTLNLGLRYEYGSPQWEVNNNISNFDPATRTMRIAAGGSLAGRALVNPQTRNFAPRFGLAYTFDKRTVLRAGYGISYVHFNRAGSGNILGINGPQVVLANVTQGLADIGRGTFRTTQQGYPADLVARDKFNSKKSNVTYIPPDSPKGMVQSYSLSIQREIARKTVLDVGYVGNRSSRLQLFADYNQALPWMPGQPTAFEDRRPFPGFTNITVAWPAGMGHYHALQVRLERHGSNGVYLLNSFVYGKSIDNSGTALENFNGNGRGSPQNFYNMRAEKAASDFDQTFNNTTTLIVAVPVGKGRRYWNGLNRWADAVLGGWEWSTINNLWSGTPLSLSYSPQASWRVSNSVSDYRGGVGYRPNVTGPVLKPAGQRSADSYLNLQNIALPTNASGVFGNSGRNIVRSPGMWQVDLKLAKNFRLWSESSKLQFRAEGFNMLNRTNLGYPNVNASSTSLGYIRSTFQPRQVQLALKVTF